MNINLKGMNFDSYGLNIKELKEELSAFNKDLKVYGSDGEALNYSYHNYSGNHDSFSLAYAFPEKKSITVNELISLLDDALEKKKIDGARGGLFEITEDNFVYLSFPDYSGSFIVGVVQFKNNIYLMLGN